MNSTLKRIAITLNWTYAVVILTWFVLHYWLGDVPWWLGLLNSFAPFLFIPLHPLALLGFAMRRRVYVLALIPPMLIFLLLYGAQFLPMGVQHTSDDTLTVLIFNVWGFSESPETAQAILQGDTPDIVALQEVSAQFADVLMAELGGVYSYHLLKLHERPDSGLMIFSRYPLTQIESDHFSSWRVLAGQVTIDGRSLIIYNIHPVVSNMLIYLEDGKALASSVKQSTLAREAQISEIVEDIANRKDAVIVMGDMNTTDQSRAYRLLASHLADAHRVAGWGFGHTFPAYAGRWRGFPIIPRQLRIDMIWYSDKLSAISCIVGSDYGESDHRPIIAELQWRE